MRGWSIQDKAAHRSFDDKNKAGKSSTIEQNPARWPGETGQYFVGPVGEAWRLLWPWKHPFFSPCPLSAIAWPRHYCQSTSLSSTPAFRLSVIALPPFCPPPLLRTPTRLLRWGWKVSAAISRLLGRPRRPLRWDPPFGARPSWHRAWGRDCSKN